MAEVDVIPLVETTTAGAIGPLHTRNLAWDVAVPVARVQNITTNGFIEELAYRPTGHSRT